MAAAVAVLVDGGYASFRFEAIAARAGVHKTTLYRRWGTRENLLLVRASQRFWAMRLELAGQMVEREIVRGGISADTDAAVVVEGLLAQIYFSLLMTGEGLDGAFVERLADLMLARVRAAPDPARRRAAD